MANIDKIFEIALAAQWDGARLRWLYERLERANAGLQEVTSKETDRADNDKDEAGQTDVRHAYIGYMAAILKQPTHNTPTPAGLQEAFRKMSANWKNGELNQFPKH